MKTSKVLSHFCTLCMIFISGIVQAQHIDIYAHRGFRALSPENTIKAYSAALKIGVDVVDMDVNLTTDGVLVVTHDLTLNPDITQDSSGHWITNTIPVKQLTFKELESYQVGEVQSGSHYQKMYPHHLSYENIKIPSLTQVIHFVQQHSTKSIRFQIEIKTDPTVPIISNSPDAIVNALVKVIKNNRIEKQVEIQSFQWKALVLLKKQLPDVKTAFLTEPDYDPINKNAERNVGNGKIWTFPLLASDFNYDYPKMVKQLGGSFWEPYEQSVTQQQIIHAHKLGLKVVTWSWAEQEHQDFDYKKMKQLIDWGVDGIITDRPDILRGLLAAKGFDVPDSLSINSSRLKSAAVTN